MGNNEHDNNGNADSNVSFASKVLQRAKALQELSLASGPRKANAPSTGFDPYNTSGSFDRKKHWERVGKR